MDWWRRLGNMHKVLITILAISGVAALVWNGWVYISWNVTAAPRCEEMIEDKIEPIVEAVRDVKDAIDFQTYTQIRVLRDSVAWSQAETEWSQFKRQMRRRPD